MTEYMCGIDFGTSNSAVGVLENNELHLIEYEKDSDVIPSAVFFNYETMRPSFGNEALNDYAAGADGRLVRSLKSMLGSGLIEERTLLRNKVIVFKDILVIYLKHLREIAEKQLSGKIVRTIAGRPVFFCDNDELSDKKAENTLLWALQEAGFRNITFEYEPVAAAYDYQQNLNGSKTALIVDIGGGTSDFSVVQIDGKEKSSVLANGGIHIGGTDFDRYLSLKYIMPALGLGSELKGKNLPFPSKYFYSLATWHLINQLYDGKTAREINSLLLDAKEPSKIRKLLKIIEDYQGHSLALKIEQAKISLSSEDIALVVLSYFKTKMEFAILRKGLEDVIMSTVEDLKNSINGVLSKASIGEEDIDVVFFAGGSSNIPIIRREIMKMFPHSEEASRGVLNSIVKGLVIKNRFLS